MGRGRREGEANEGREGGRGAWEEEAGSKGGKRMENESELFKMQDMRGKEGARERGKGTG